MRAVFTRDANPGHLQRACDMADLVTAPTQALLDRYAVHKRGVVIPNCLPRFAVSHGTPAQQHIIGWSGRSDTHPGDLEVVGPAVANVLANRPEVDVHVIGDCADVAQRLGLDRPAWSSGWLGLGEYYRALTNVTVAIIPLGDTLFNHAKSGVTGLAWAAAGVPFVASPTPEYERLADQGIGYIARTPDEWEETVSTLLSDSTMRARCASKRARSWKSTTCCRIMRTCSRTPGVSLDRFIASASTRPASRKSLGLLDRWRRSCRGQRRAPGSASLARPLHVR